MTASHVFPRARAFIIACVIALGLAGCVNPKTGQDVSCGGDRDWAGGGHTFGYNLMNPDDNCAQ